MSSSGGSGDRSILEAVDEDVAIDRIDLQLKKKIKQNKTVTQRFRDERSVDVVGYITGWNTYDSVEVAARQ